MLEYGEELQLNVIAKESLRVNKTDVKYPKMPVYSGEQTNMSKSGDIKPLYKDMERISGGAGNYFETALADSGRYNII